MMSYLRTVVLVALLVVTAMADGQTPVATMDRKPSLGICAAEVGGGLLGTIAFGGTFAYATIFLPFYLDNPPETKTEPAVMLGVAGALGLVGCSGGTWLVGSGFSQHGEFLPTLGFATATSAVGLGLYLGGAQLQNYSSVRHVIGDGMAYTGAGLLIATPLAAVVGYGLSRPHDRYGSRLLPGSVALGTVRDTDGVVHPSVNVRLLSVRF